MNFITKTKNLKNAKKLYNTAFPKYERIPYFILKLFTLNKNVKFTEYYDNNVFVGITYTAETDYTLYLYYFAISDNLRGKGYGSKILNHLKTLYPNKTITLNIEPLDENSTNYNDRLRRYEFYKRNGFYNSGYTVYEVGGGFTVLYTKYNIDNGKTFTFNAQEFVKVFKKLSGGFIRAKIEKTK